MQLSRAYSFGDVYSLARVGARSMLHRGTQDQPQLYGCCRFPGVGSRWFSFGVCVCCPPVTPGLDVAH
eukprot:1952160-Lingulodinium_polyedra.AAC.1